MTNSISTVPNEILFNIISALDLNEVEKCQLVSRKLHDFILNSIDLLPLYRLKSMGIGVEYGSGPSAEMHVNVTRHINGIRYQHINLIEEDSGEDHGCDDDRESCDGDVPMDQPGPSTALEGPEVKTLKSSIEIDYDKIRGLKYCVVEECDTLLQDEEMLLRTLSKLHEISGSKLNVINFDPNSLIGCLPTIINQYMNVSTIKTTLHGTYDSLNSSRSVLTNWPVEFFIRSPKIPSLSEKLSIRFPHIYEIDNFLEKLMHLNMFLPHRYSLAFDHVDVDLIFFISLIEFYKSSKPEVLVKSLKFFPEDSILMHTTTSNLLEFLNKKNLATRNCIVHKYWKKMKNWNGRPSKRSYEKKVYEIKKSASYVMEVQYLTDLRNDKVRNVNFCVKFV